MEVILFPGTAGHGPDAAPDAAEANAVGPGASDPDLAADPPVLPPILTRLEVVGRTSARRPGRRQAAGVGGRRIVGIDLDELHELLERVYASEWRSYYQYWLGARVVRGPMKDAVAAELTRQAIEELDHAHLIAARIGLLAGKYDGTPPGWSAASPCSYAPPEDPYVAALLDEYIADERCTISMYRSLMVISKGRDLVTHNMGGLILEQEAEHLENLQRLRADLTWRLV